MRHRSIAPVALALTLLFLGSAPRAQTLPADLDKFVERARHEFGVVGLAVAVVKDDRVVHAKGFGERTLGRGDRVDERTLFAIGSNTKAFTAAAIGTLVDEKKMSWNDRVTERLPWFQLYDPWVTREITVRDLLSHRSGLGRRGDANWYATDFDRREILERIRYLEPNSSFRSEAGYQNTMFLAAGEVAAAVSGQSWDQLVTARIFKPAGMTRSLTTLPGAEVDDVAQPHERLDGTVTVVPYRRIDNIAPAGSIMSSVADMSRWMRLMLNRGELEGTRILSESTVAEVWKSNIVYPLPPESMALYPSTHFSTYGLGWGLRDYRGRFVATHTGGIDGMLSQVLLVPEERLGIVVLTNTSPGGTLANAAITFDVLDAYLGAGGQLDWIARFKEMGAKLEERQAAEERKAAAARVSGTSPSLALDRYAGKYENQMYGELTVALENGHLVVRRHTAWAGDLEHWHFDTFQARWRDRVMGKTFVTFRVSADGTIDAAEVEELGTFRRVAAR